MSTGRKATSGLLVEPLVELLGPAGEGRDRDAVVLALAVGDLPGLVQLHQAGGEHLRVDAVVAAVTLGEQSGDRGRDAADAGLEGGAVGDEPSGVLGDRPLRVPGRRVRQGERSLVALDQDVDLVDVERVRVVRLIARRPREELGDFDDQQAIGIVGDPQQLVVGAARVQREAAPAVGVWRGRRRREDPRA